MLVGRQRRQVATRTGQPVVTGDQGLDVALHPHLRVDEHDDVVADPLQVGDHVRGEQHADLVVGDGLHQCLQELASGQRVEAGDRLVEDEQLRPLGETQGQGELRPLTAGEPAGLLLRVEAEPVDAGLRDGLRPTAG